MSPLPNQNIPVPVITTVPRTFFGNLALSGSAQPELTVLTGDEYSRTDFAVLNDAEFTELLSSIEGIGISEFFVLYDELYDQIPSGSLDVGFGDSDNGDVQDIFRQIDSAASDLRIALREVNQDEAEIIIKRVRGALLDLTERVRQITTLLANAEPNTHAYLIQQSVQKVITLTSQFQKLFSYLVMLSNAYSQLLDDYNACVRENEELKKQIKQLNDIILKLTAPASSGFQVVPDLFTATTTPGITWEPGQRVEVTVCGSADYTLAPGNGFETLFTIMQIPDTSKHTIIIDPHFTQELRGKTAYVTATSNEVTAAGHPTEQIVFVVPNRPTLPVSGTLVSSVGNTIALQYPDATTTWEDFYAVGYKKSVLTTINGGTPPYTITNNVPPANEFFTAELDINALRIIATRPGNFFNAITVRDSDGNALQLLVDVREVHANPPEPIPWVSVNPAIAEIEGVGTMATVTLTYGQNIWTPEISLVGTGNTTGTGYHIERNMAVRLIGNMKEEDILIENLEYGEWNFAIFGGPTTGNNVQSFMDNAGITHLGATPFMIHCRPPTI